MSIRSLIEINHDLGHTHWDGMVEALAAYLASGDPRSAAELERYGIRVIGQRHHSGFFFVKGTPDGFPVRHVPPREEVSAPPVIRETGGFIEPNHSFEMP